MAAALLVLTLGGIMVYSALTGTSIVDVLAGQKNDTLDSQGGSKIKSGSSEPPQVAAGDPAGDPAVQAATLTGGANPWGFAGPHPELLVALAKKAQSMGLTITSTSQGNHVPGSYHYQHRAFDCAGAEADMQLFARYIRGVNASGQTITELIHNPGVCIKDGKEVNGALVFLAVWAGHRDHVHVAV